ncbi:hypothetical protein [Sulfurovum mangrovi]|uniref:hypothetical protein n=1 Tax=Sulfurovum mangrovi TaxID=2893889 RepID=UPI001E2FA8E7|nr:hypothetical protein [Sulfurovum mangrovi]UFH58579.1 hypothetical protein LN246_09475 [Sulfurovum mangrovi]
MAQGGTFKSGFASGFSASFFSPGTTMGGDGAGGFGLRTSIAAIVGGTASALGGGKFANGAISGAFVHMFNSEGKTIGQSFKQLWTKLTDGTITGDIAKGFEGGLKGYREVRDNSPWYAQLMLKSGMTAIEMGLTGWISFAEYPIAHIWYNTTSGVYMDTFPYFNKFALPANIISGESGMNTTWFE